MKAAGYPRLFPEINPPKGSVNQKSPCVRWPCLSIRASAMRPGGLHAVFISITLLCTCISGQIVAPSGDVDPAALDPYLLVDAVVPMLNTVRGGDFGTAISIDSESKYPIVSAPAPVVGLSVGVCYGFSTLEEQWFLKQTVKSNDTVAGDKFGYSLSSANNMTAIGAPLASAPLVNQGVVYVRSSLRCLLCVLLQSSPCVCTDIQLLCK